MINYEVTGQRKVGEGFWASRGSILEEGKYMGNYKDKGISVRSSFLCVQIPQFHVSHPVIRVVFLLLVLEEKGHLRKEKLCPALGT